MNKIKRKIIFTILIFTFVIFSLVAAITLISALSQQTFIASLNISYHVEDIDGSVNVKYQLLSKNGNNDGEIVDLGTITFEAEDDSFEPFYLSPDEQINLSSQLHTLNSHILLKILGI